MGQPKLLLPWGAGTLIDATINAWQAGGVERIVAVVRDDDQALAHHLKQRSGVRLCRAHDPPDMTASVLSGLRFLEAMDGAERPRVDDAWLFAPADLPRLSPALIGLLCRAHLPQAPAVLIPTLGNRRGHPVLVPWRWRSQFIADDERSLSLRERLRALPQRLLAGDDLAVDGASFADIDLPEDYQRLHP